MDGDAGMRQRDARAAGAARRVAVVDVGSNSVRLVVFEGAVRAPDYFFNEKTVCGLGARLAATGRLDPEGRRRALQALRRFAALVARMEVGAVEAVATAAVREAEDGPDFVADVERETGLRLRAVDGLEEARLSALGVLMGEPDAAGAAADMGGASVEVAALGDGAVGERLTLALGPQRLAGLRGAALTSRIAAEADRAAARVDARGRALFVVGGAWRAVAKAQMARVEHPLTVLHGHRLDRAAALEALDWIARQSPEALKALPGVSANRAGGAPLAARVLARLTRALEPERVVVSAFGLREGLVYQRLSAAQRRVDPLLEACRRLEAARARFPGFGEELAAWLAPLAADWPETDRRLLRAACLLNDVNWRAHPDYRAVSCFETVTRANLAAVDHPGRVFLGLALTQRYGGGRGLGALDAARALLAPERQTRAKAVGRGMRLGAMLCASTPGALSQARLSLAPGVLALSLAPSLAPLSSDVVARRLKALADALGREPRFRGS